MQANSSRLYGPDQDQDQDQDDGHAHDGTRYHQKRVQETNNSNRVRIRDY